MTIIDNTTPKSSKFVYDDWYAKYGLDPNATKKEKDLWWGQEEDYWKEGRFGLTGPHYFLLSQLHVKEADGNMIRPVWRDLDDDIYEYYTKAASMGWDIMYTKRREAGLSLTFGGVIPLWTSLVFPGSVSLITSADKPRMEQMYKEKTLSSYASLDPYYRPGVVSNRQFGYLHLGQKDNRTGIITGLDSMMITKDTVDKPTAFEAFRAKFIFVDEFFLHPHAPKVFRSSQSSTKKGFMKNGTIVMGGSAGEASAVGQKEGRRLWESADVIKMLTVFLPGWKGIMYAPELDEQGKETGKVLNFCPNGHSDEKAATEWIMRTRENLDKLEDKSFLENFIKSYPLDIHEVFVSNTKGNLPEDVMRRLNEQERIILGNPPPKEKGQLMKDFETGKIKFMPTKDGKVVILRRPIEGHTYIAGMDPIPFNSSNLGDGSDNCIVIKDIDTNEYVAYYRERLSDPDLIVENSIMLQDYYFGAKVMLELNRGGVVYDHYKKKRIDLLAPRPNSIGVKWASTTGQYCYHKNDKSAERGNAYFVDYLRHHADSVWFDEVIEESRSFLADNTDMLDAMICCEIYHKNIVNRYKEQTPKPEYKEIPVLTRDGNGRVVKTYKRVRVK